MSEKYYIFKVEDESDCRCQYAIPDDAFLESSEEADEYLANGDGAERGYSSYEEVEINEAHHFIGYFFDTDNGEAPEDEMYPETFNSMEHLKIYWHTNGVCLSNGHFDYQRIEEVKDGKIINVETKYDAETGELLSN